jgi:hypothetical protein
LAYLWLSRLLLLRVRDADEGVRVKKAIGVGPGLCGMQTSENAQQAKFAEFLFHEVG